jgi:hypothetical protein
VIGRYNTPALRFTFTVTAGPHAGAEVVKTTGAELRPGTQLGDLLGRELRVDESVNLANLAGREFDAFAVPSQSGGGVPQTVRPVSTNPTLLQGVLKLLARV